MDDLFLHWKDAGWAALLRLKCSSAFLFALAVLLIPGGLLLLCLVWLYRHMSGERVNE